MWKMAQEWRRRPSEFLDIQDPLVAYYFDRAIYVFGTAVENDMEEQRGKAKDSKKGDQAAQRAFNKWINPAPERFRDPLAPGGSDG